MAGIIKANHQTTDSGVQAIAFNLDDITDNANSIVGQVRDHAAKIVEEAKDQAAKLRKKAEHEGRQAALQSVQKTADAELERKLQTLLPALQQTIDGVTQERDEWRKQWETNVVHLAIAIAGRVLRHEIESAPEVPLGLIREALELASGSAKVRVRLNPQDLQSLGDRVDVLVGQFSNVADAEVVGDPEISPGGSIVSTEFGEIDQTFEAQLARIRDELT